MYKLNFLLLLFFSSLTTISQASLLPDYDNNVNYMHCGPADISLDNIHYLHAEVPKKIYQIWFGDQSRRPAKINEWIKYSIRHGYDYRVYSEKDLNALSNIMSQHEFQYIQKMIYKKDYWAASDILRVILLKTYGGIYIDCDFSPPVFKNKSIDFTQFSTMRGITFVTEHHGRNIGTNNAIFVMNGIIMSCKNHPIMHAMSEQIIANSEHYYHRRKKYSAMYCTGPFLLNRVMNGCYNVLPVTFIEMLNMDIK